MEAKVIVMKCSDRPFGVRIQRMENGDWYRTWAFRLNEKTAEREGFDRETVHGSLHATAGYPGCPDCGSRNFFLCYACGKASCWHGETNPSCSWCGRRLTLKTVEAFDISGDSF